MHRNLKDLGPVLMAVLALSAVIPPTAWAFNGFTSTVHSTIISGSQVGLHQFFPGMGITSFKCTTAEFSGVVTGTSQTTHTVKPNYAGCTTNFGRTVHVTKNTAEYHFNVTGRNAEGTPTANLTLTGELGFTETGSPHCTITIKGDQTFTNAAIYHNNADGSMTVTVKTAGIHTNLVGGFACGVAFNPTTSTTGEYQGHTTIKGTSAEGSPVAISTNAT